MLLLLLESIGTVRMFLTLNVDAFYQFCFIIIYYFTLIIISVSLMKFMGENNW